MRYSRKGFILSDGSRINQNENITKTEHLQKHEDMVVGLDNLEIGRKYKYMNKGDGKRLEGILLGVLYNKRHENFAGVFYINQEDEYEVKFLGDLGVLSYDEEGEIWNSSGYLVETNYVEEIDLDQEEVKEIGEKNMIHNTELETF